jgi:hypothetical protein
MASETFPSELKPGYFRLGIDMPGAAFPPLRFTDNTSAYTLEPCATW